MEHSTYAHARSETAEDNRSFVQNRRSDSGESIDASARHLTAGYLHGEDRMERTTRGRMLAPRAVVRKETNICDHFVEGG